MTTLVARTDRTRHAKFKEQSLAIAHQRLMVLMLLFGAVACVIALRLLWLTVFSDVANGPLADGARLIGALLGPAYVKDKALAGIVIGLMDQQYTPEFVASLGLATPMYLAMAGSNSNVDFVKHVFNNVVGRQPLAQELNTYVAMLENGSSTQASLAVMAASTDLNAARIDLVGLVQHGWEYS